MQFYRILLLLLPALYCSLTTEPYKILTYPQIIKKWRYYVSHNPQLKEWNITQDSPTHRLPANNCAGTCYYPIFEYTSDDYNATTHLTVFLVGGFHGDEPMGSWILTYGFNLIKYYGKHVIFLPVANPSGFIHGIREEVKAGFQPSMVNQYNSVDPNRDFPFETVPNMCFRGATSRVIDYIYRKWKIQLSITLHQGGYEIAWNWGSPYKKRKNIIIDEDEIAETIGVDMRRKGGTNSDLYMNLMKIGNMNYAIYSVEGSYYDWAYGASWDDTSTSKVLKCDAFEFEAYPRDTHQGLVFIVEAGPKNLPESRLGSEIGLQLPYSSKEAANGFITRALRIVYVALYAANPHLVFRINGDYSVFCVKGCDRVSLSLEFLDGHIIYRQLNGSLSQKPTIATFPITYGLQNDYFQAKYDFVCDKEWLDKGKTRFGGSRRYRGSLNISIKDYVNPFYPPMPLPLYYEYLTTQQKALLVILTACSITLLGVGILYIAYWRGYSIRQGILKGDQTTGFAINTNTEIVAPEEMEEEKEDP